MPPKEEQDKITGFLDKKTAKIYGQIERAQKSIDYLREFRTALISEAVTGKINVRN
ncbi:MAG: type I restriction endonuclease subunit S [Candidatus Hydrogenedentes bacterium CG07_land_8_20_14_0_80_42_17]|nr:MAG: type I restriction endonuclease subunit S [Candidatus Hydrogenedentes bacterium CG07_land_8_20_14_0_80_42_17]